MPFAHQPDGFIPGMPVQYATTMDLDGGGVGLLVTSYDGRPIKVEGNPSHPDSLGATGVLPQAAVLEVYDPDRSTRIVEIERGQARPREWDEFAAGMAPILSVHRNSGGAGLRVLSVTSSSPTLQDMKARFLAAFPQARWHEYEPLTRDNERDGAKVAFGRPLRAQYALDRAEVGRTWPRTLLILWAPVFASPSSLM